MEEVYLTSISTDICELENKIYRNIESSLEHIYAKFKEISNEYTIENINTCNFFDRDVILKCFNKDNFINSSEFINTNIRSEYGEFIVKNIDSNKYQFIFAPYRSILKSINPITIIVCEIEKIELLD